MARDKLEQFKRKNLVRLVREKTGKPVLPTNSNDHLRNILRGKASLSENLKRYTKAELANMAKKKGIRILTKNTKNSIIQKLSGKSPSPVKVSPNGNISKLTVAQLRQLAKNRGVKLLSKNTKPVILQKLSGKSPSPMKMSPNGNISKLTVAQLRQLAKNRGVKLLSKNTKPVILKKLAGPSPGTRTSPNTVPIPSASPVSIPNQALDCIERSKLPLRDYQKLVCRKLRTQRGLIAVHSVGSGKTLTAVTASQCFLDDNPGAKVIVVTPVSLIDNFKKEMETYGISRSDKRYEYYSHAGFALQIQDGRFKKESLDGNMIIIDEIHNYRITPILERLGPSEIGRLSLRQRLQLVNEKYKPTRAFYVRSVIGSAKKVLGLTATPIVNSIEDLRNLISFVDGTEFMNRKTDPETFGIYIGGLGGKQSEAEIIKRARGIFSFYERDKGDPRFPSFDITNMYLTMPEDYLKSYNQIEQQVFQKAINFDAFDATFFNNIRNAVNKIDNTMNSPKVLWALRKIQQTIDQGGKALLYSAWIDSGIQMIAKHLDTLKIGYNFITGEVSQTKRQQIVKDYNSGKKPVILISKAGGEGLDLKGTTAAIMLEPTWNPAAEMQVFGRAVRSGSHLHLPKEKQHVKCYLLMLKKPDEPILDQQVGGMYAYQWPGRFYANPKYAADQIINAFTMRKREKIREIYTEISKYSIEGKQFKPWSANRQIMKISA